MHERDILIVDDIDFQIVLIADALELNMNEKDIIQTYINNGFSMDEIYLLLTAGKILYNDRKTAIPVKKVFRRVP